MAHTFTPISPVGGEGPTPGTAPEAGRGGEHAVEMDRHALPGAQSTASRSQTPAFRPARNSAYTSTVSVENPPSSSARCR